MPTHDRPHQFETIGLRKDQQRAAGEGSAEVLAHRHEVRVIRLGHQLGCLILGQNLDSGDGEQNLVLHHLTQTIGGARHRDVRHFAEGVALQLGQRGEMPDRHRRMIPGGATHRRKDMAGKVGRAMLNLMPISARIRP